MLEEEWIGCDEADRWGNALKGIAHGYWHGFNPCRAASLNTGEPVYLYVVWFDGTRVVCPVMQRTWRDGLDLTTPIGFSGLASSTGMLPPGFADKWLALLRARGVIAVYLAQHPLYAPLWPDTKCEFPGSTLYLIHLDYRPEHWLSKVDANRRRSIRSWEREGGSWIEDRSLLTEFIIDNHAQFMKSVNATQSSYLNKAALHALCNDVDVELVGVRDNIGICTAAAFGATSSAAELLLHISVRDGRRHTAALMWWAYNRYYGRVPTLNLGGTPNENDALAQAKRRYRPQETPLRRLKVVVDAQRYEEFCGSSGVDGKDLSSYFPAYRAPG